MHFFNLKTITAILATLSLTNLVSADDNSAIASPDSAVVKLTADTFEDFIKSNPLVLAEFFAPWCGHCKKLGPEFSSAADTLLEKDIKLAQVDCTEERDLCSDFEIRGYPSLKVFRGTNEPSDYQGQRQADSIVNYMTKLAAPPVTSTDDSGDLLDLIADARDTIVLQVLPSGVTTNNATFYDVANELRDSFTFASTSNADYVEKYASKESPAYVLFRLDEEVDDASVYEGTTFDEDSLREFIDVESKPLFGEINGSTFKSYMDADIPLAYYFWNEESEKDAVKDIIIKLGKKFRGKINFVGLEAKKFGMHAKNLNMKQEFPLFVIHDIKSNLKYGISQDSELQSKDIAPFVENFDAGKLEPIVKSEPIPTSQNESVYHLVGYEHEQIVNAKKDVLVKYYAPWCGHCKKLAPVYEELASVYASDKDANDKVLIAKIDHTENDVAKVDIKGYPTLILYPADGSDPVEFSGARTLEGLAEFIKDSGSNHVDGEALIEAEKSAEEAKSVEAPVDAEKREETEEEDKKEKPSDHDEL